MTTRAILFDVDGTLVDSNGYHVAAWRQVFAEHGTPRTAQAIHDQIGKGADNFVPALLRHADAATVTRMGERHGTLFQDAYMHRVRPFPHARDLLVRVRAAGLAVVLASSAGADELDHYLGLLDAHALVDATTSKDEVAASKPARDIFATACAKVGVAPTQAIAVGDTPYDIAAAAKSGIGTVAVRSGGFGDASLRGALAIYDDVAAILRDFSGSPLDGT